MNARYEKGSLGGMGTGDRIKRVRQAARLSQEKFAEIIGRATGTRITRGAVGNWELGGGISRANLTAISDQFDVDLNWLERGKGHEPNLASIKPKVEPYQHGTFTEAQFTSEAPRNLPNVAPASPDLRVGQVPIKGRGMGGKLGALVFDEGEFLGETAAHPKVYGVPDAFAVYVIGDSMLERYRHGEIVYIHPYAPYVAGDDVLIQVQEGEGQPVYGYVKRFVSESSKLLKVQQLNPRKTLTFQRATVVSIQKIVGSGSI